MRPRISFDTNLEKELRLALEGVDPARFVVELHELSRRSRAKHNITLARMALDAALARAVFECSIEQIENLIAERLSLGFESVTDVVFSLQSVVVAAMARIELRPPASEVLAEIERHAADAQGLEQQNGVLFVQRMRQRLSYLD